jgi:hypothetical protein
MNFLEINGVSLEVRRIAGASHKRPLVFLHEGLGSVSLWTQRGQDWPQPGGAGLFKARLRAV